MVGQISDAVRVTARILPEGVARREFGNTLFLDYSDSVVTTRDEAVLLRSVRTYPDLDALSADAQSASVREAANIYFQQVPFPKSLLAGYVIATVQPALLFGVEAGTLAEIEALDDGVALTLNGVEFTANFDTLSSYADIATELNRGVQTATGYNGVTCLYDEATGAFQFNVAYPTSFGTGFAATDAAETLGIATAATILEGIGTAETPSVALSRIADIDCNFFGIAAAPAVTADFALADSLRDWVAARRLSFLTVIDVFGPDVLVQGEDASIGAQLSAQSGDGIAAFYNGRTLDSVDHKGLSYLGRFSSINYDRPNAVINGKFLDLPGTLPTELTATEKAELDRKRINWYERVGRGSGADTKEGKSFGTWFDVYVWLAWFKDALEVEAYNFLKQTAGIGGVPITNQGLAAIADALEAVCERGVRNGGLAPNFVSPAMRLAIQRTTGNADFDGFLSSGYLVHRPRAADVDQVLRNNRGPIPISIFAKGSGKVNFLDIDVVFEN